MNYRNIIIPFLNKAKISNEAERFRQKLGDNFIPVDMEDIIEIKLQLSIVPIKNLKQLCDTDALITSNWRYVYVDYDGYLDPRYRNRLRFSLAHEMGHFVLHKNLYRSFKIKKIEDYYRWIRQIPLEQYHYFEIQANKFANYLLVPRKTLIDKRSRMLNKMLKESPDFAQTIKRIDKNTLNSYLAIPISKIFGVSSEVIEIALNELDGKK